LLFFIMTVLLKNTESNLKMKSLISLNELSPIEALQNSSCFI
jgi:hypothetical protein